MATALLSNEDELITWTSISLIGNSSALVDATLTFDGDSHLNILSEKLLCGRQERKIMESPLRLEVVIKCAIEGFTHPLISMRAMMPFSTVSFSLSIVSSHMSSS